MYKILSEFHRGETYLEFTKSSFEEAKASLLQETARNFW